MEESVKNRILEYLEITARAAGFSTNMKSLPEIVGAMIGVFLSLLGIIFLCLILYGGFLWMTAGGNEEKVLKAKKTISQAVVGLTIILSAYAITRFVFDGIIGATTGGG